MKKKICVVTGSRSEYGLLFPLLRKIVEGKDFKLNLIVTGMHLRPEFGYTYREIEKDGFRINKRVNTLTADDTVKGIASSVGKTISKFVDIFLNLKPEAVIILGDRFEIFSVSVAAHITRTPIVHIHGGELTEGVVDDAFRHAITKMSSLHFAATDDYRRRIIQLGESPSTVFNVGALGLDNMQNTRLLSKEAIEKDLGISFNKKNLLVTFHPAALKSSESIGQVKILLKVLDALKGTHLIFTKANADTGGRHINRLIDRYVKNRPNRAWVFTSLGRLRYLSILQFVDAVVGNSSSGIIEAPSFKIGTINIGDRQKGRVRARSVLYCEPTPQGVKTAIDILYSKKFQAMLKSVNNPYGGGDVSGRIIKALRSKIGEGIVKKSFYDILFRIDNRQRK